MDNITKELVAELTKKNNTPAGFTADAPPIHHLSLLVNPFTQGFMSIDSGRITCPLIVENGLIKPSLILSRNDKVLKLCSEFQENAIYVNELHNKRGSLEYGFSDTGDKIICRITDFERIFEPNISTSRIIQFDQNSQESDLSQWLEIKHPVKQTHTIDGYRQFISKELQKTFGVDSLDNHNEVIQLKKSYWFNFTPEGFMVCITDLVKKVLITTLKDDGTFGSIPTTKKIPLKMIKLVWPELVIRKKSSTENEDEDVLISEALGDYFPDVRAGVLRITKFHNDSELKCIQTHSSCC